MDSARNHRTRRRHQRGEHDSGSFFGLVVLPALLLLASTAGLGWFLRRLLLEAEQHAIGLPTLVPLFLALLGLTLLAGILVFMQANRSASRLNGPIRRLAVAMQRTCGGDLAHRVHLRRGDALRSVAAEYNKVLDWLNENPPEGARTGTDVVEVAETDRQRYHDFQSDDDSPADDESSSDDDSSSEETLADRSASDGDPGAAYTAAGADETRK